MEAKKQNPNGVNDKKDIITTLNKINKAQKDLLEKGIKIRGNRNIITSLIPVFTAIIGGLLALITNTCIQNREFANEEYRNKREIIQKDWEKSRNEMKTIFNKLSTQLIILQDNFEKAVKSMQWAEKFLTKEFKEKLEEKNNKFSESNENIIKIVKENPLDIPANIYKTFQKFYDFNLKNKNIIDEKIKKESQYSISEQDKLINKYLDYQENIFSEMREEYGHDLFDKNKK